MIEGGGMTEIFPGATVEREGPGADRPVAGPSQERGGVSPLYEASPPRRR